MIEINDILDEREKTHGDFADVAGVYSLIKSAMADGVHSNVDPRFEASLDMIAMKMARIVCGNPNHIDSWRDISAYSQLIVKFLENTEGAIDSRITMMIVKNGILTEDK